MNTSYHAGHINRLFVRWASGVSFHPERPEAIISLLQPVGLKTKPLATELQEQPKTLEERKAEFMDIQKNRMRREELKKEFAKPSFEHIYKFRHTGGKIFYSPPQIFPAKDARYMANIPGTRLDTSLRTESSLIHLLSSETANLVRIFSSSLGRQQINQFTEGLDPATLGVRLIDVNVPTSWFNRFLVRLFGSRIRRSEILDPSHQRYLLADTKPSNSTREAIAATNDLAGYLYVVDKSGKIRWLASGPVIGDERVRLEQVLTELRNEKKSKPTS